MVPLSQKIVSPYIKNSELFGSSISNLFSTSVSIPFTIEIFSLGFSDTANSTDKSFFLFSIICVFLLIRFANFPNLETFGRFYKEPVFFSVFIGTMFCLFIIGDIVV